MRRERQGRAAVYICISMEKKSYIFEFIKDASAGALTWHSAPFTGSVEYTVPKGTRGLLGGRMNVTDHYFEPIKGYYTREWLESIINKAKEESPCPQRFNGGLSFFIPIKTLLSDAIRFLPQEETPDVERLNDDSDIIAKLQLEYSQAVRCAIHEESESFKEWVRLGMCSPQIDDDERQALLEDREFVSQQEHNSEV